jgi:hypothetical protein
MELADAVFTEVMKTFKDEVMSQFPKAAANSIFIREGGGSAAVIFGSYVNLSNFDQYEISKKLSAIFASKITDLTKLSFYEKQALKDFAGNSEDFPSVLMSKNDPESISDVLIASNSLPVWANMSVREVYNTFWPKGG